MSWANIASKNPSSVDIAAKNASVVKVTVKQKPKKSENYTSTVFPTHSQILCELKDFFVDDIAGLIKGYAVFAMDLSWCDPGPYLELEKKNPRILQHMAPSNKVHVMPDQMKHTVCDQDFVEKFQIDGENGVSGVTMDRIDHYGYNDETIFTNIITFNIFNNQKPINQITFAFPLTDLKTLIGTRDCEEFTTCVNKIFVNGETPYRLNIDWDTKKQKMELLWECWRKIIAPKYVLDNLNTLTGYKFGNLFPHGQKRR